MNLGIRSYRRLPTALGLLTSLCSAFHALATGCVPAPAGLAGWWSGDGNANDVLGASNGTLQGGATAAAAGVVGSAFSFDGTNNYVQIPNSLVLRPTNLTIEAWVLFTSLDSGGNGAPAGQQYIVFKQNSLASPFEGYTLFKNRITGGDVLVFTVSSALGQIVELQSTTLLATGVWYHVAGVRGSNYLQLYVNGQLQSQANVSFAQDYGNFPLYFGTSGQPYWDRKLKGLLDEVSLYNRALSSNEVAAIYAANSDGKCKAVNITAQPQSQAVVIGTNALFTVSATGFGTLGYQWQFNGANVGGATGTSLLLTNVQSANAGSYLVVVSNTLGAVTSAVALLTITPVSTPPSITQQPTNLTVVAGNGASFSVTASGTPPPDYQWQFNGANVAGATGTTLVLANVQSASAGNYRVVVTNLTGSTTSAVATLTVWVPPAIAGQPQSRTNTLGTDASFSVTASGTPAPTYQWQFNGVAIPGATGTALLRSTVSFAHAGAYRVVLTNEAGAVTSAVAMLTVVCPSVTLSPGSLPGATAGYAYNRSFGASGGAAPYNYSATSGSLPPGLILSTGGVLSGTPTSVGSFDFVVRAADTNACWASKGYTLVVGCPGIMVGPTALASGMVGNAYQQTLAASGGYGPYTFAVAAGTLPAGFSLSTAGALSGVPAVVGTNSFTVRATDTNSCSGSQLYALAVTGAPPVITQQPMDLSVLAGASATFTVAASSTLPLAYQWQFNWANVGGATGTSLILDNVQSASAGPYRVIVSNAAGAVTSAAATLSVLPPSACVANPNGLVGWWPGDGNANDLAGANHGILQGEASASAVGRVGSAFSFDGTNGCVRIPDTPALRPTNLTIEAWVRFNSLDSPASGNSPAGQQYLVFREGAHYEYFAGFALKKIRIARGDVFDFEVDSAGGQAVTISSQTLVVTGAWYHVAGVRGPNYVQLYVNGELEGQTSVNFAQSYGNYPLYLGTTAQPSWDHKLAGALDEVSLYNRALSANEVAAIYAAQSDGRCRAVTITAQPQSRTLAFGANASLTVSAVGSTPLGYQWQRDGVNLANGGNISGVASPVLSLGNASAGDSGNYRVVVANVVGAVTSAVAVVRVLPALAPPSITTQPVSQTASVGTNVTFAVASSGTAPFGYQWRFNGTNLAEGGQFSGTTNPTMAINCVLPVNAGGYSVVVSNEAGVGTSAVAMLTVSLPSGCIAVPTGLVGWWPGDGNANDIVCTNHGALQGGASASAAGVVGSAFSFDGTNGCVQIPNCPMLRPANLTIEAWVRFSSLDSPPSGNSPVGQQYLVFREGAHYDYFAGFALKKVRIARGDVFEFEVDSADGQAVKVASQTLVATGAWYHVAGARGTNYLQLYVNGQLEGQTNVSFPQSYADYPLYFGTTAQPTWDHKLAGALDEVSLYNRALDPPEIAVIYAAGSQGKSRVQGILAQPSCQLAYWGGSASFTSAPSGSLPLSYQWQKDGLALPGANTSALNLTNLQLTNAGLYTVWITSAFGNATSPPASLSIKVADLSITLTPAPGQGQPVLTIGGLASRTYGIQANTSPAAGGTWTGLTNLVSTARTNVWYDPVPANQPQRFYRVVPGPIPIP